MTIEELKKTTLLAKENQMEIIGKYLNEIREMDTRLDDHEFMRLRALANQGLLYWRFSVVDFYNSINNL